MSYTLAGTPTAAQTTGDCKQVVCNGSGATTTQADGTDLPVDGKACTSDVCSSGVPSNPPVAAGAACNQGGGKVCDGAGSCVECNVGADCASLVCSNHTCPAASCSDSVKNGTETDVDCGGMCAPCGLGLGCSLPSDCQSNHCTNAKCTPAPVDHLLLSEIKYTPTASEFIEIYNPTSASIDLGNYWLADYASYYQITTGGGAPNSTDFRVHFPAGASIAAQSYLVVSMHDATAFQAAFGFYPDFDFAPADANAPDMIGQIGGSAGLTDSAEMVMLFQWDGVAATIKDVDYMTWGNTSQGTDKTGLAGYQPDTPLGAQVAAASSTISIQRCDLAETSETKTGGNGLGGHDETSESGTVAWKSGGSGTLPTPKAAPAAGLCP